MDKRLTVLRRELWALRSEKTIIFALVLQLLVASFSSVIVVGLVSVYSPDNAGSGTEVDFAVTGGGAVEVSESMDDVTGADASQYADFTEAYAAFQNGDVHAIIRAEEADSGRIQATVYAPDSGIQSTVVVVRARETLSELQDQKRVEYEDRLTFERLEVTEESDSVPFFSFSYTVLVPILLFLPTFISGSLASDTLTEGITTRTIELLRSAPLTDMDIVGAKVGAMALLAPAQVFLWLLLLEWNGIVIHNMIPLLAIATGATAVVTVAGAMVALQFRDRGKAQFVYSAAVIALFGITVVLPEHPINTVAKLSIGAATPMTFVYSGLYLLSGVLAFGVLYAYVSKRGIPGITG